MLGILLPGRGAELGVTVSPDVSRAGGHPMCQAIRARRPASPRSATNRPSAMPERAGSLKVGCGVPNQRSRCPAVHAKVWSR